jgi:hypothetical protein
MLPIIEVVSDPEWQSIRRSFLGTWKKTPADNVARLRAYLGDGSDPLKVRRLLNYLTGSAFRIGVISHPHIDSLLALVRTLPRI